MALPRLVPMGALALLTLAIVLQIEVVYYAQKVFHYLTPCGVSDGEEFDFVVVGAGSAGATVSGRLAEQGHSVLLVEAGGPPHYLQYIPAFWGTFLMSTKKYSWVSVLLKKLLNLQRILRQGLF